VLPVAPLPDAAFALGDTAVGNSLARREIARERCLDEPPARSKISVAFGHSPHGVEVIGQNDHRVGRERMTPSRFPECGPQFVDVIRQQPQPPLRKVNGKEEAAPGNEVATIVGHVGLLVR
jgi:hypothetical protein